MSLVLGIVAESWGIIASEGRSMGVRDGEYTVIADDVFKHSVLSEHLAVAAAGDAWAGSELRAACERERAATFATLRELIPARITALLQNCPTPPAEAAASGEKGGLGAMLIGYDAVARRIRGLTWCSHDGLEPAAFYEAPGRIDVHTVGIEGDAGPEIIRMIYPLALAFNLQHHQFGVPIPLTTLCGIVRTAFSNAAQKFPKMNGNVRIQALAPPGTMPFDREPEGVSICRGASPVYCSLAQKNAAVDPSGTVLNVNGIAASQVGPGGQRAYNNINPDGTYLTTNYHKSAARKQNSTTWTGNTPTQSTWVTVSSYSFHMAPNYTQYKGSASFQISIAGDSTAWGVSCRLKIGGLTSNVLSFSNPDNIKSGTLTVTGITPDTDVTVELQLNFWCDGSTPQPTAYAYFYQIQYTDQSSDNLA